MNYKRIPSNPDVGSERRLMGHSLPEDRFICPVCKRGFLPNIKNHIPVHVDGSGRDILCDGMGTPVADCKVASYL